MENIDNIVNNIKHDTKDFDFLETIGGLISNEKFKSGLSDLKVGYNTKNTYIWEVLSAINNDISETIYDNVLKYIENISNVDTCKISALKSMLTNMGVEYSIFNNYDSTPLELQQLIDILSINKHYLIKNGFLNNIFRNKLTDIVLENDSITDEKYEEFLSDFYESFLMKMINLKYSDRENSTEIYDYIWYGIKEDLLQINNSVKVSKFIEFKTKYNISNQFNEEKKVDDIEEGKDSLDNYDGYEKELLIKEIEFRAKPINKNRPQTKYNYYREKKVREYFKYIETNLNGSDDLSAISIYELDKNYLILESEEYIKLIDIDNTNNYTNFTIAEDKIKIVAKNLAIITLILQNLRSKIKCEVQKNYMKGTYNLLKYVINEYLINLSDSKIFKNTKSEILKNIKQKLSNIKTEDINIIEYYDNTEYFNIDTNTIANRSLNDRYWNEDVINYDTNTTFKKEQIANFYEKDLYCKIKNDRIENFLSSLYDYGASKTHIKDNKIQYQNDSQKNAEYSILMNYGGQEIAYHPYYNHKNTIHPSFQIHPYLNNFTTDLGYRYPIENAFYNNINYELEDNLVSKLIGDYGQILDVAMNNQYDFSGYRTRYEQSPHSEKSVVSRIIDYEGAFYPQAVLDLINDKEQFIYSIENGTTNLSSETFYEKYYSHLDLTQAERKLTADRLSAYFEDIKKIVSSDKYDIYKYAIDKYENVHILYKNYDDKNIDDVSIKDKQNTTGQLWIRLKNHPIAFPALNGNYPIIDLDENHINGSITLLANENDITTSNNIKHNIKTDIFNMSYFYDFEIDKTRSALLLIAFSKNNNINHDIDEINRDQEFYNKYEFGDIIICNIEQSYDVVSKVTKLKFLSDNKLYNLTHFTSIIPADKLEWVDNQKTIKCILGIFNTNYSINILYIEKVFRRNGKKYDSLFGSEHEFKLSLIEYNPKTYYKELLNLHISLDQLDLKNYLITNTDIKFNYVEGLYTLACLTKRKDEQITYNTYIGLNETNGQVDSSILSSPGNNDTNSFDHIQEYICIIDANLEEDFKTTSIKLYNLNVDASYLPQFSGKKGFHDYTLNDFISQETFHSIELLGKSNNLLKNIEVDTTTNIFSLKNLEQLNEFICGRVYENYTEPDHLFESFLIKKMPWKGSSQGDNKIWEIKLEKFNDKNINLYYLILGNKYTSSKNLYYVGKLIDIITETSIKTDCHSYTDTPPLGEIKDKSNEFITMAGTYNMLDDEMTNKLNTNYLHGVNDIKIKFNRTTTTLQVKFETKDEWLIQDNEIFAVFFNPSELRMYEWYHLMEPVNKNISKNSLSSIDLKNYSELSDINCLKGVDGLTFKNSEEEIFEPQDIRFYYPGLNTNFPLRACDVCDLLKEQTSIANYENLYVKDHNTFLIKMNNMNNLFNFNDIKIPYYSSKDEVLLVYEDYLSNDSENQENRYKYDNSSIKNLNYSYLVGTSIESNLTKLQEYVDEQPFNTYLLSTIDHLKINYDLEPLFMESGTNSFSDSYINYKIDSNNFDNIEKYNNIYVQYDNDGNGIALYFNYMNFYQTPFVKIENNECVNEIIKGSYLKLLPNEEGILDIVIQIRYHLNDRSLMGITNLKLASYKIFNLSDDKPKFVIQKISDKVEILNGSDDKINNAIITVNGEAITITDTNKDYYVDITCVLNTNFEIDGEYKYWVSYPKNSQIVGDPNSGFNNVIEITGNKNETVKSFRVKLPNEEFLKFETQDKITFNFNIIETDIISKDKYEVNVKCNNGIVICDYNPFVLRQEPNEDDNFILLENNDKIITNVIIKNN